MWKAFLLSFALLGFAAQSFSAQSASAIYSATQLAALASTNPAGLKSAITASFTAKELQEGTAWSGRGPDFFFAVEAKARPALYVDGAAGPQMQAVPSGDSLWYASAKIPE